MATASSDKVTTGAEVQRGRDYVIGEMCDAIQSLSVKFRNPPAGRRWHRRARIIDKRTGRSCASPNLPDWIKLFRCANKSSAARGPRNPGKRRQRQPRWERSGWARPQQQRHGMYTLGTGVGGGLVFDGNSGTA